MMCVKTQLVCGLWYIEAWISMFNASSIFYHTGSILWVDDYRATVTHFWLYPTYDAAKLKKNNNNKDRKKQMELQNKKNMQLRFTKMF